MRKIVLVLCFAAMGAGAYRIASDRAPWLLEGAGRRLRRLGIPIGPAGATSRLGGRISRISSGESVDVANFADPRGRTIIDFTAPW